MVETGFVILGIFLGCCLTTLISVFIYERNRVEYCEITTGIVWDQLNKVRDFNTTKFYYLLRSSYDGRERMFSEEELSSMFVKKTR